MPKPPVTIRVDLKDSLLAQLQDRLLDIDVNGVTVEQLAAILLEKWLVEDGVIARHGETLALKFFAEHLPFEMTLKYVKDGVIRYLWANRLFLRLVGLDSAQQLYDKVAAEVWKHIAGRGEAVEEWDRSTLTGGRFVHVDTIPFAGSERHRLGIRFCIGQDNLTKGKSIVFLASLGIDFSNRREAEAARRAIERGWPGDLAPSHRRSNRAASKKKPLS